LSQWVDIHHHLLHHMDDGPQTMEDMISMLHAAVAEGVACIVATPHMLPGMVEFDAEQYQRSLMEARQYVEQFRLPLRILPGAEIYYTTMTPAMLHRGVIPHLGSGHYVLVEFHPHVSFDGICRAAVHIANTGSTMVLAHAERYRCLHFGSRLNRLRQGYRVVIQVNAETLLRPGSFLMRRWIRQAMENEWIDVVASDAHDVEHHPCLLGQCAAHIENVWGRAAAERICSITPRKLINY